VYVKWHFKTDQGIKCLSASDADRIASSDPDYAIRDLYNAIGNKTPPSWTMYFQVMTFAQAEACPFNPFDVTKVWSHTDFPLNEIGRMTLDRNPNNYFAEVEQLAFAPSHMVPGIEPSPDKMLQGRLFSYSDTHRHRLGTNYQSIPVNCPLREVTNYQRDGAMSINGNQGNRPNYFPNSFGGAEPNPAGELHVSIASGDVTRFETGGDDNFTQCGDLFRNVLSAQEKENLTDNIAGNLVAAKEFLQARAVANFAACDPDYGRMVEEKLSGLREKALKEKVLSAVTVPRPLNPPRIIKA
jgi:catalase